ncbi:MaoC family dehydratase [Actinocorallia libanotica]|uniref:MaoC family dehydratase n=1 Tax=Actinocorallia libanotica TaxID=46162 RepID=A0ABN1RRI0_9ACTN
MAATIKYDEVEVGTEIPARSFPVKRLNLVMYAGASGDFNIIHWDEKFATSVGLPDVIAHGMFTMAQGGRFVTDWVGDPGAVLDYGVRFSGMVPVPHDTGNVIEISGVVEQKLEDNKVVVGLSARESGGQKVLGQARAVVRLA